MSNMSYCRFENTLADLRDCENNMNESDLSKEEKRARIELIQICERIANDYGDEEDE